MGVSFPESLLISGLPPVQKGQHYATSWGISLQPTNPELPDQGMMIQLSSRGSGSSTSSEIIMSSLCIAVEDSPALQRAVGEQAAGVAVAGADGYELSFKGRRELPVVI